MPKRINVHILWKPRIRRWVVTINGIVTERWDLKRTAVARAAEEARNGFRIVGRLTELHIHTKTGQIHERRTYGRDPRRTRG